MVERKGIAFGEVPLVPRVVSTLFGFSPPKESPMLVSLGTFMQRKPCMLILFSRNGNLKNLAKVRLAKAVLFYSSPRPPPVRSGLQILCKTNVQNRRKKSFKFVFPAEMSLNSGEPITRTAYAFPYLRTQKLSVYQLVLFIAISMLQFC